MKHLDLFSGIGGFALAVDTVWDEEQNEHIFCDNEPFAQAVLNKHWPNARIFKDVRTLTNATVKGVGEVAEQRIENETHIDPDWRPDILTGGFPCQPFSAAGLRKGTEDDRHLWPEMFRIIRETAPRWVVGENVRGFVTWNDGMVLEQVCTDLESIGYEVWPFIIPAVAVNAPHRRDRVWIVGHSRSEGLQRNQQQGTHRAGVGEREERTYGTVTEHDNDVADTRRERWSERTNKNLEPKRKEPEPANNSHGDWDANWFEVATRLCRMDDGVPKRLDRNQRLKALGNAIVPQVAIEIMRGIKTCELQSQS